MASGTEPASSGAAAAFLRKFLRFIEDLTGAKGLHHANGLNRIVIHRWYKSGQILAFWRPFHFHAYQVLFLGSRLPKHGDGAQGFAVYAGHQENFPCTILLPQLANLYLPQAHRASLTVETEAKSVNNSPSVASQNRDG